MSPPGFLEHENTKALRHFYETNQSLSSSYQYDEERDYAGKEKDLDWLSPGSATLPLLNLARDDLSRTLSSDRKKVRFAPSDLDSVKNKQRGIMGSSNQSFGNAAAGLV